MESLQFAQELRNQQIEFVHQSINYKATKYGHLHTIHLNNNRYGFLHVPDNYNCSFCLGKPYSHKYNGLLLIYHGSRDIAFDYIFKQCTYLLEEFSKQNYLLFFGQSDGVIKDEPYIHPKYKHVSYGELYWGIRSGQNMMEDIQYTKDAINTISNLFRNDCPTFIFSHSNGAVFSLLLTVHMPNTFKAIISHQGGLGYDSGFYIDFDLLKETDQRVPILLYTGTHDVHKEACEGAYRLFSNMDFPCEIIIAKDEYHGTISNQSQQDIFDYIINCEQVDNFE